MKPAFFLEILHPRMRGLVELRATSAYAARIEVLAAFGRAPTLTLTLMRREVDGSLTRVGIVSERAEGVTL